MEVCAEEEEVKASLSMMEIQKKILKTETLLRNMWFGDKYKVNQLKSLSLVASGEGWYRRQRGSYCSKERVKAHFKCVGVILLKKWLNLQR